MNKNKKTDGTINGKTIEEVLGKNWKEKLNHLKGDEIIKERERLIRLINEEKMKEDFKKK